MDSVQKRNYKQEGNIGETCIEDKKEEKWYFSKWIFAQKKDEENVSYSIDSVKRDIEGSFSMEEPYDLEPSDLKSKELNGHISKTKRVLDLVEYELYWLNIKI